MEPGLSRLLLPDGRVVIFEDDVDFPSGERLVSITDLGQKIDFRSSLESLKSAANLLLETFHSLIEKPDECEIEFGVKLSAAAGAVLAKAGGEASFRVKMKWAAEKSPAAKPN